MGLVAFLIVAALMVVPFWRLLPRAGIPAPVALVSVIPLGVLVLLWIMAFKRWPNDDISGRFS